MDHDIDGVISMLVASCRATTDLYQTWREFTDALDKKGVRIPTCAIEADMVDTRTYSDALVKERLTAFMEVVDEAKRQRQKG
ncbi:unnamed protein product [marine sediment metagenome]|uniref:Uncharacterized protein n=1 Tax=marine sediment metagenome TaxID=412755 RepID=X0V5L2_9ZZZZ